MFTQKKLILAGLVLVVVMFGFWGANSRAATKIGGMILAGASSASLNASAVCPPTGGLCSGTLTSLVGIRIPFDVTLNQLFAFQANAPASGSSCSFTVRKSAGCTTAYSATSLSCTIAGNGSARTCQNTGSSALASAGDCLQVQFTEVGTCSGFTNWGFEAF